MEICGNVCSGITSEELQIVNEVLLKMQQNVETSIN
jgi:MarR family transcriptional regulator, organic hydroperoxide resistance regulator